MGCPAGVIGGGLRSSGLNRDRIELARAGDKKRGVISYRGGVCVDSNRIVVLRARKFCAKAANGDMDATFRVDFEVGLGQEPSEGMGDTKESMAKGLAL